MRTRRVVGSIDLMRFLRLRRGWLGVGCMCRRVRSRNRGEEMAVMVMLTRERKRKRNIPLSSLITSHEMENRSENAR